MQTTETIGIIAYTYDAEYHCIFCTGKKLIAVARNKRKMGINTETSIETVVDNDGNEIHPLFSTDEWMELDESYLSENPIQHLTCGDCHKIIETYKHQG